jgi:3-hydroxybutyryl-CoA dehydrogenase
MTLATLVIAGDADSTGNGSNGAFGNGSGSGAEAVATEAAEPPERRAAPPPSVAGFGGAGGVTGSTEGGGTVADFVAAAFGLRGLSQRSQRIPRVIAAPHMKHFEAIGRRLNLRSYARFSCCRNVIGFAAVWRGSMKQIVVIGAGTMGNGIAHTAAASGFDVTLIDVGEVFLERGMATISKNLKRGVDKGKMTAEDKQQVLDRIRATSNIAAAAGADIVIEAIIENLAAKTQLFAQLDALTGADCILASNTSSISITKIAAATKRPDKVIGMHFMNPVPVMTLVEVIRGIATSDETYARVAELSKQMGKTAIEVNDYPGFISNRVLMPMINEAIFALFEGVATAESIDGVMKLGMNHPMGPLTLADFIGLDVCLAILRVLEEGFGDPKYRPCPLLVKMVDAGWLGRKSERGFYDYRKT